MHLASRFNDRDGIDTVRSTVAADGPETLQTDRPLPRANRVESGEPYQQA